MRIIMFMVWTLKYTLRKKCPYSELFWSAFSNIRIEYGEIRSISLYSVQMRENPDQNNSEYSHFSRSDIDTCLQISKKKKNYQKNKKRKLYYR